MTSALLNRPCGLCVRALRFVGVVALALTLSMPRASAGPFDGTIWAVLSEQDQNQILQALHDELTAVRAGQVAQRTADEEAAKTLSQRLDDLYTPQNESAWRKYSSKYALMAADALRADAARFAQMAGAASAGNYTALKKEMPRVGATLFASIVGDILEEKGHDQTKLVWDTLVNRAGSLQQVGTALLRGDTGQAFQIVKGEAISELESLSQNTVAGVIDWAFTDLGVAPGQAYLQVIAYEKQFIRWSQGALSDYFIDTCLQAYVTTYNRTRNAASSLSEYDRCALLGGAAYADREFDRALLAANIDPDTIRMQMLEAYRTTGQSPRSWISDLVASRIAEEERRLTAEIDAAQAELMASSDAFAQALGQRLSALALAAMTDAEAAQLTRDARAAITGSQADADAVARAAAGAVAACAAYDAAKTEAEAARAAMARLSSIAFDIRIRARDIPDCGPDGASLAGDLTEARRLRSVFDSGLAEAQAGLNAACTARDGIDTAADQPAALALVQSARDGAAQAQAGVEAARKAHSDIAEIRRQVTSASQAPQSGLRLDLVAQDLARLDGWLADLRAADAASIAADFATAKGAMHAAQRRVTGLITQAEQRADLVRAALEPHRSGPLGAELRGILQALDTALSPALSCQYGVEGDWFGSRGYTYRSIDDAPDLASLQALVDAAKARCPQATAGPQGQTPEQEIDAIFGEVDASEVLLDIAQRGYEQCLADALLLYSDIWSISSRPTPTLAESILIVFDASGSMGDDGRIEKARAAATAVLQGIQAGGDIEVALMVFYDCGSIRLEVPFTTDPGEIIAVLPGIRPSGSTPLAAASAQGRTYLQTEARGARKRFILLTDGEESCGGDPVAAIGQ
ncbi:vWA domain-containing protein [Jannaschia seohaensis]|nr:vWA domain-containing protein [Jannaschia seohaensis]